MEGTGHSQTHKPAAAATAAGGDEPAGTKADAEDEKSEQSVAQMYLNTGPPPNIPRRELVFDSMSKILDNRTFGRSYAKGVQSESRAM